MQPIHALPAVPLLILLNAFFVAAEYALVAIREAQIETLRERGWRRSATAMAALKARPADAIGAIQVCITMTNLLLGWLGEPAMSQALYVLLGPLAQYIPNQVFMPLATLLSFLVVTLLTVVFSELLPKALTLRSVQPVAVLTAVPMHAIGRAIRPLVWLMNALANTVTRPLGLGRVQDMERELTTAQDIMHLTQQAAAHGQLNVSERDVILNTLALGKRTARQIMIPRQQVAYLDMRWTMQKNREVMDEHLYSRLPLCDGGLDRLVGVVRTKEFLTAYEDAADTSVLSLIAFKAVCIPEVLSVDRLLTAFREQDVQMMFVVDEYGGVEGIVTLRDVVDELLAARPVAPASQPSDQPPSASSRAS
jgi:CBS domain containing-hemolysin-like protein